MALNVNLFTLSERTVKKYTVQDAFKAALMLCGGESVCTDYIYRRHYTYETAITLVELNEIVDRLVDDTHYYA